LQEDWERIQLPVGSFDLVFLWHALEHMDDPGSVMGKISKLLAPTGLLVLVVPNGSGYEARRFKKSWFHLDVPWHKYHFSRDALDCLAETHGMQIIRASSICLEQGPYGLLQSTLNALGWPHNELYEFLKGRRNAGRGGHVALQIMIGAFLGLPVLLGSLLSSFQGKGPALKLVLRKKSRT
jgi:SAM-dependent methyltransferase